MGFSKFIRLQAFLARLAWGETEPIRTRRWLNTKNGYHLEHAWSSTSITAGNWLLGLLSTG